MRASPPNRGVTWIEVLVILVVIGGALAVLIPAIGSAREAGRYAWCNNRMKQIGLGVQNYASSFGHLPSPGDVVASGDRKLVRGWSMFVKILPYLEYGSIYDPLKKDGDPDDDDPNAKATRNQLIKELRCHSNTNRIWQKPATNEDAVTNYKVMGATHLESLNQCLGVGKPLYGDPATHPDGAMFPGKEMQFADIKDGTSHTICVVETMDDTASVWTRAADTILVGLPTMGRGAVTFEKYDNRFFAPSGFNGQFDTEASARVKAMRTFLGFNFRPGAADAGTYPAFGDSQPAYGPSSSHPKTVNHLFIDGSVKGLSKDIDPAAYMFMITRDNGDPFRPEPDR